MNKYLSLIIILLLSTTGFAKNLKGAEYRTKAAYTYGRFEVSYKSAQKDGTLASFFTYHEGTGSSTWNEIDIEILGRYEDEVQFNTITPGQTNHVRSQYVNFNPASDFHTYAFEWTPDYIAWFVDGSEVYRQTGSHVQTVTRAQKIMMNIWQPAYANWVGEFNPAVLPAFAYYDWVKYYSYTPGKGNYGTNNNFTLLWTDDFNSWDQSRWEKATHTWDGNNCDFIKENAVFKDGKLVLCLTGADNIGYTDIITPFPLWSRASHDKVKIRFSEPLDKTSAENKSLYLISGVTISKAELLQDNTTVELTVTGLDLRKAYNVIIMGGVKDLFNNSSSPKAVSIAMPKSVSFPLKINVGGSAANGYLADQEWSEKTEYGYLDGTNGGTSSQISNTEEDAIFQTERYGLVTYKLRVPDGTYKVTLMTSEKYFNAPQSRVFDVYAEGILSADNVDIYKEAGKNSAYLINIPSVLVNDGVLDLHFPAEIDNASIDGIVVEEISTGVEQGFQEPDSYQLFQNYPNPFNNETKIKFMLSNQQNVTFRVFDMLGNQVYEKNLGRQEKGNNEFVWQAKSNSGEPLASGIYIYSIAGVFTTLARKLILLK